MCGHKIGEVQKGSPDYPILLNNINCAPNPLYFIGGWDTSIFKHTLAVVGSRAVTMYGEWVVKNIVKDLARCGITIVSGFMYGVDALAHQAALDVDGKTIAVMAGSIENVFPKYQQSLYEEISVHGLIVSEYKEKGAEGHWMFARRNRIVAGLSKAVLVVEAGESSGSLITANYAKAYGRQVLAVPGNLNAPNSFGTTKLLKEGAKLVSCANDILEIFSMQGNYRKKVLNAVNERLLEDDENGCDCVQTVEDALRLEPLTADELSSKLNIPSSEILRLLTGLSLYGSITERNGRYHVN